MDPNPAVIPVDAQQKIINVYKDAVQTSFLRFPPGFTLIDFENMHSEITQTFEAKAMSTYVDGDITHPIVVGFLIPVPKKDEKTGGQKGRVQPKKTKKLVRKGKFIHFLYLGPKNGQYIIASKGVFRRL